MNVMIVTNVCHSSKCDDCDSHCSECDDHDREQSLVDVMTVTGLSL